MRKLKLIIFATVVGGAAAVLWLQHSINAKLRRDNEALRLTIAESKRSQNVHEPIAAVESMSRERLEELLKLRNEVTRLHQQTNQIGALVAANQKLAASLGELKASEPKKTKRPEDALPQDIHPRDSWAFRGYGSPDDTMESMAWAGANNDRPRFLAGMAPELKAEWEKQFSDTEIADKNSYEFRILDRQIKSDDLVMLTICTTLKSPEGNIFHKTENTFFKRIDGEWRVADSAVTPD